MTLYKCEVISNNNEQAVTESKIANNDKIKYNWITLLLRVRWTHHLSYWSDLWDGVVTNYIIEQILCWINIEKMAHNTTIQKTPAKQHPRTIRTYRRRQTYCRSQLVVPPYRALVALLWNNFILSIVESSNATIGYWRGFKLLF